ncbi:MAG: hypothetical protein JWM19_562 [Actinomycetia bacterium]|nr:hypothetical protein [Actinomycetes bacterium]
MAVSWSRLIRRCPVSMRLSWDGLMPARSARLSSDQPRALRSVLMRIRLAELLEMDAQVLNFYLAELTGWIVGFTDSA